MGFKCKVLLVLTLAALSITAAATASIGRLYVLPHPRREHCKVHYVKKVEHVKGRAVTVCAYVAPKLPTFVLISDEQADGHFRVHGSVTILGSHDLIGVPITYKITDESTGQTLGSFTEPSDAVQPCALVLTEHENRQTFTGEAAPPEPACPIAVSLPTGQLAVLSGSFAGNSTYAPSVSEGKGL